jgi:cell division protein FtsI (penicillin-binding protein 3)
MSLNKKKQIIIRTFVAILVPTFFGIAIIAQTFKIQVVEGKELRQLADSLTLISARVEPERGNIYSEDGSLLSTSLPYFEVRIDFRSDAMTDKIFNENVDSLAYMMSTRLGGKSVAEYKKELIKARQTGNRYYLVKRNVQYPQLIEMKQWPFFRLGRYKSGMIVLQKNKRENPFGILAVRTIGFKRIVPRPGFPDIMDTIRVGIEGNFDEYLAGREGQMLMQKISGGTYIPLSGKGNIEPVPGYDVNMTLDINMQDVVESALLKSLKRHKADHGCAILMEVKTGKIKAIANLTYKEQFDGYVEYYNYAIGENTEPGSTFKLMTMAALLDDGHVKLTDLVDIEGGEKQYYDRVMKDVYPPENDTMTVMQTFAKSSNVGISKLVTQYYTKKEKFYDKLVSMHINKPTGIEIVGESNPTIYKPEEWSLVSLPWMSIGYEVQLSPLQTLTFYNAIANNGKMMKPYLVSSISDYERTIKKFEPTVIDRAVVSESTVKQLKKLMEIVVEEGTASGIKTKGLKLAGKTGTSRIANEKTNYRDKVYQASFAGYFPADEPMYSCIVVINNPRGGRFYGSSVAAPVFQEIAKKIYATSTDSHKSINENPLVAKAALPKLGNVNQKDAAIIYNTMGVSFQADKSADYGISKLAVNSIELTPNFIIENTVPKVVGMDLKDALYVLENAGLKVEVSGVGKVKQQSLKAGQQFNKGQTIKIHLSI